MLSQTLDSVGSDEVTRAGKKWGSADWCWFYYLQQQSLRLPALEMPYSLLNIPDFAFPSLPSHYRLHGQNWIAFFLDQVIPWSTEHQCQSQTGFWQPVSMPVLINRGQTLSECEVCSSCWASPLLPALSLPYSLPPLCFSFGGDFALPHHIFQAVWRCFLCTIFSITQWCCILVLDFFPHWMATELIQYCGSVSAWGRTPVAVSTAFFHLQLFTHPLRCRHHPDALTVQGHMWLFYHHHSIFLIYLVSKQGHFGDCPGQWNIDFSAAVTGTVISLFQTSPCRVSLSHCLKSGWLTWLVTQLRRRMGY